MSTVTPEQQREDCQTCLISGLKTIGISATTNDSVDFGAINDDDQCIALANSIEVCLGSKYFVAPLSTGFVANRKAGSVVTITAMVDGLVLQTIPKK